MPVTFMMTEDTPIFKDYITCSVLCIQKLRVIATVEILAFALPFLMEAKAFIYFPYLALQIIPKRKQDR